MFETKAVGGYAPFACGGWGLARETTKTYSVTRPHVPPPLLPRPFAPLVQYRTVEGLACETSTVIDDAVSTKRKYAIEYRPKAST